MKPDIPRLKQRLQNLNKNLAYTNDIGLEWVSRTLSLVGGPFDGKLVSTKTSWPSEITPAGSKYVLVLDSGNPIHYLYLEVE